MIPGSYGDRGSYNVQKFIMFIGFIKVNFERAAGAHRARARAYKFERAAGAHRARARAFNFERAAGAHRAPGSQV